jgi:hypothetical protein
MIKFSKFVDDTFGKGSVGKEKAARQFKVATSTLYVWYNSDKHYVFDAVTHYKLIEIKKELLK